jgi:hypothetical protein
MEHRYRNHRESELFDRSESVIPNSGFLITTATATARFVLCPSDFPPVIATDPRHLRRRDAFHI